MGEILGWLREGGKLNGWAKTECGSVGRHIGRVGWVAGWIKMEESGEKTECRLGRYMKGMDRLGRMRWGDWERGRMRWMIREDSVD